GGRRIVHKALLCGKKRLAQVGAGRTVEEAGEQPASRIEFLRSRPVAGYDLAPACADESPDQSVKRLPTAAFDAGQPRRLESREARGVACRKDHQIGVEVEFKYFAELKQPVGPLFAERGQERRLRGAAGPGRGDQTVRGEMENAEIAQVVALLD